MFNFDPTVSILNATICPAINDPFKAIEIAQSIINDSGDGPQYTSYKLQNNFMNLLSQILS